MVYPWPSAAGTCCFLLRSRHGCIVRCGLARTWPGYRRLALHDSDSALGMRVLILVFPAVLAVALPPL
ncbi:hypothetical protein VTO73DRAFT_6805 [Trametes versicolor]